MVRVSWGIVVWWRIAFGGRCGRGIGGRRMRGSIALCCDGSAEGGNPPWLDALVNEGLCEPSWLRRNSIWPSIPVSLATPATPEDDECANGKVGEFLGKIA